MKIEVDLSRINSHEARRIAAMITAYADYPPEGLEISSGPVTVHAREGLRERAKEALKIAEGAEVVYEEPPQVEDEPTDVEKVEATVAANQRTDPPSEEAKPVKPEPPGGPIVPETQQAAAEVDDLKKRAQKTMLAVTKAGTTVVDLKAKLEEAIPGVDPSKYDADQYRKAIDIMEGLLSA